jgi:hypothetical protein
MRIGMEPDPIEDLERALERAVAEAAKAQFGGHGNVGDALAEVYRLSRARLDMDAQSIRLFA